MNKSNIITVKNAEGDPDTQAEILIQNKIDYTPKVSVIIPVYNVEEYLCECLDSVVNQTLKEIEIICVDDGSTDNSLEILKEYAAKDNRITIMKQKNLYAGVARNAGLAVAKGEYLSFLDSDDWFELTLLDETYNLSKTERSQIVLYQFTKYNNALKQKETPNGIYKRFSKGTVCTFTTDSIKDNLYNMSMPSPWNKLIKRDLVINEKIHFQALPAANDVFFSLAVLACSKSLTLYYKSLVYYRYNRINNLVSTRDKNPFNFYTAHKGVYHFLKARHLYDNLKTTFIKAFIDSAIWEFSVSSEKKEAIRNLIINQIIPEFQIESYKHLLPEHSLSKLTEICNNTPNINVLNKFPKISVIIPVYNVEKYLRECLDSVINQTLKEIEIICIDDGSTDSSLEILKEYAAKDKRFTILQQENKGAGAARNVGLKTAKGEFLSFLDADDFFEPNMLDAALNKIQKTEADFVIYNSNQFDDKTKQFINPNWFIKYNSLPNKEIFNCSEISCNIFKSIIGWPWDKLYRSSFVKKYNLYYPEIRSSEDALFVFSALFLANKISVLEKEKRFVHHRINNLSSLSNSRSKSWTCFYYVLNALKERLIKENKFNEFEHDFVNYALHFSLWNFRTLKEPIHSFLKEKLKNEWFKYWGITSKTKDYFEDKNEYQQLLSILNDNNKPIKIAIHGSCCSREFFNSPLNTFNLGVYLLQNPINTIFEKPYFNIKENEVPSNSDFMRRMVATEFNKKALKTLANNKADYLMIDLGDLRLERFNINFKDGKKTKILKTNDTEKQLLQLQDKLKNFDFTIESSNNISEKEWDFLINKYVTELKKIYPINKIILNKLAIASQYEENGKLVDFTKDTCAGSAEIFRTKNLLLKLQDKLEKKLKGCLILDNPPFPIIADSNHKLGLHSLHLKQNVYDWKMGKLQEIVMISPKVSIIMPCYNTAPYLRQALDSVVNQTLKDIEIICVNDGSTDNTLDIIKEYAAKDNRIVVIDGTNGGYGKAMNKGLDKATGEYIGILEPDDYLKLDMYETQYKIAKENNLDFIKADFYRFVGDNYDYNHLSKNPKDYNIVCKPIEKLETFLFIMNTWSGIYRRDFIEKFNIRHNETPGASFQDNGFFFQTFCFAERAMFLDKPFYMNRRDNPNSSVKSKAKVYCMNDEYKYIKDLLIKSNLFNKTKEVYEKLKFNNYMFTLSRIDNSFKLQYVFDIADEFKKDKTEYDLSYTFFDYWNKNKIKLLMTSPTDFYNKYIAENEKKSQLAMPILFKDIGFGCKTWCEPKNVTGDDIKSYTYDLSDNIYTRYVSWDPIKEGSCDVEIIRLYAVEKRTKKIVEFPVNKIVSNGKILGNKVEFRNQKGCWIGCTVEGAYESFTIEAKIKNI